MQVNKKKISIGFLVIVTLVFLISLDYLVNMDFDDDPTRRNKDIGKSITDIEVEANELSRDVFYENDEFVFYTDRIIKHFDYDEENIGNIFTAWRNLSKEFPKDVNAYIVPVPSRIIFEKGYEQDKSNYDEFYQKLEKSFLGLASIVDLRNILDFHKDEYIFYRTLDSITARGGYYASKEIGNAMGTDFYLPLSEYNEHMYREYIGSDKYLIRIGFEETSKEYDLFKEIPNDLTYFYLLPKSKNVCEIFLLDENSKISSIKQPTVVKSGTGGGGSMISAERFEWAVAEGDSKTMDKRDETLLLISDTSGRYMLPYFSNYYKNVYYINLRWNKILGSELQMIKEIFEEYEINDIVYVQESHELGDFSYGVTMKRFLNEEVR